MTGQRPVAGPSCTSTLTEQECAETQQDQDWRCRVRHSAAAAARRLKLAAPPATFGIAGGRRLAADRAVGAGIARGGAVIHCIADLGAVAEDTVVAQAIIGRVVTRVGCLVARVYRAADEILTVHRRASLAGPRAVTGLVAIAVHSV